MPIVKAGHLEFLFRGFPVVVVQEWREVNASSLRVWANRFRHTDWAEVHSRLTVSYWTQMITQSRSVDRTVDLKKR